MTRRVDRRCFYVWMACACPLVGMPERAHAQGSRDAGPEARTLQDQPLAEAFARHATAPSVDEVVRAALAEAALHPRRVEAAVRRARRAGLLPLLRVGVVRGHGVDLSARQSASSDQTSLRQGEDLRLEATLTFALDRLVYGVDEVAWSREARALESQRESLVRDVVTLYYRRLRLLVERELLGDESMENTIGIAECEALLQVFTGGTFSRMMAPRSRSP